MIQETISLWTTEEYQYPVKGKFMPNMVSYIHDEDEQERPVIVVVPGGGYCVVSDTEGEIVALEFYNKGYNAFVVTYTTDFTMQTPLKFQPLKDLSKAVAMIRKNASTYKIIPNNLVVCGFSAGGHLTGSLAVHHGIAELDLGSDYKGISNRPDAVILSYPVISSGVFAHSGSFVALLGADATVEERNFMSLEKQVTADTSPTFIWHTATDELVPVENSYLFAEACHKIGVKYEHHVFGEGKHGLSLANELWASGEYGGKYTLEQYIENMIFMVENNLELPFPFNQMGPIPEGKTITDVVQEGFKKFSSQNQPNESVAIWPVLAHNWLKNLWQS